MFLTYEYAFRDDRIPGTLAILTIGTGIHPPMDPTQILIR